MDRISNLPNCLLHQILSFLDTNAVVQTSKFSKRWKNVWISTPYLNFSYDFSKFAKPLELPPNFYECYYDEHKKGFLKCIAKVLNAQNGHDINKIVIHTDFRLESKLIKPVIDDAVKHRVREIEIMVDSLKSDSIEFPKSIYNSGSLQKLKLIGYKYDYMWLSKCMGFRALKELRLHQVLFLEDQSSMSGILFPARFCQNPIGIGFFTSCFRSSVNRIWPCSTQFINVQGHSSMLIGSWPTSSNARAIHHTNCMRSEKEAALAAASTPPHSPTIFDKIISKEIPSNVVYEDDKVLAFRDINPQAPTHILIIPKAKDGLSGLSKCEERHIEILGRLLYTAKLIAKQEGLEDGFRIVINDGPKGCQSVYHIHVHLLGGRQMEWPAG